MRYGGRGLSGVSSPWLSDEGVCGGGTLRAWLAAWWKSDTSCILCLRSLSKAAWDEAWKNLRPMHPPAASLVDDTQKQKRDTYARLYFLVSLGRDSNTCVCIVPILRPRLSEVEL